MPEPHQVGRIRSGAWRPPAAILAIIGVLMLSMSSTSRGLRQPIKRPAPSTLVPIHVRLSQAEDRAGKAEAELELLRAKLNAKVTTEQSTPPPPPPAASGIDSASSDCNAAVRAQADHSDVTQRSASGATRSGAASLSSRRLSAICRSLAPAVAVRPAPLAAFSSRLVVELSPWYWAAAASQSLAFDPDGITGALSTPWGEGRWGSLPRHPAVLWASFASRDHLLWVRGSSLISHRCSDNETVTVRTSLAGVEATAYAAIVAGIAPPAAAAGSAPPAAHVACARTLRLAPWTLWAAASSGGFALSIGSDRAYLGRTMPTADHSSALGASSECAPLQWECTSRGVTSERANAKSTRAVRNASPAGQELMRLVSVGVDGGLQNVTLAVSGEELLMLTQTSGASASEVVLELASSRRTKLAFLALKHESSSRSGAPVAAPRAGGADLAEDDDGDEEGETEA